MKKYKKINYAGFTLIELLVVVAVIAILSLIGLTIFSTAQANARDARRKADVDAISKAIEINKTPGTIYYTQLPASGFSAGKVPTESFTSYISDYCIRTSLAETTPSDPTDWAMTLDCPPALATANESLWIAIPSAGLPVAALITDPTSATSFGGKILSWKVCARLEASGTNATAATGLKIFCYPSSQ